MEVRIKNHLISEVMEFFYNLKLNTGRESRHRSRFLKKLNEHLEDIKDQQKALLKQHCRLDEKGEPRIIQENDENTGKYDIIDEKAYEKDYLELMNEEFIINDANSQLMLKTIRKILDEYDGEKNGVSLSGRSAVLYDYLCEVFKVDEEIEEDDD